MKKLTLLLAFIILNSCITDTIDDNYYQAETYMNPPFWINGIWKDNKDRMIQFTSNDLLYKYPLLKYTSASDEIDDYKNYYLQEYSEYRNPNIQEVELIDYYSIKYNCLSAPSKKFSFFRISGTQIESTGFMPGIYTRQ